MVEIVSRSAAAGSSMPSTSAPWRAAVLAAGSAFQRRTTVGGGTAGGDEAADAGAGEAGEAGADEAGGAAAEPPGAPEPARLDGLPAGAASFPATRDSRT